MSHRSSHRDNTGPSSGPPAAARYRRDGPAARPTACRRSTPGAERGCRAIAGTVGNGCTGDEQRQCEQVDQVVEPATVGDQIGHPVTRPQRPDPPAALGNWAISIVRARLASTSSRSPAETHDGSTSMAERPQMTRTDRACGHRGRNLWIKTRLGTTRHQHRKCQSHTAKAVQPAAGSWITAMPARLLVIAATSATSTRAAALSAAKPAPCSRTC